MTVQGEQLQLLVENVQDRMNGAPIANRELIPMTAPGVESIIIRDIHRTVSKVENKIKLALSPKRKTNLPKTPREVYEDKEKYYAMGCFPKNELIEFPTWDDLTATQKAQYDNDPEIYSNGTLPWDIMTNKQKNYFASRVIFVPNKVADIELLDGKGRAYLKLYERNILKVHSVSIYLKKPGISMTAPMLYRTYTSESINVFPKEGAIQIMPLMAQGGMMMSNQAGGASTSFGVVLPRYPQLIHVDYTFGLKEIPEDLKEAVSLLTAAKAFESINIAYTQGLTGYSVQGFSASFQKGMYADVIERYKTEAEEILSAHYTQIQMSGW